MDYFGEAIEPEKLMSILNSIGLEVEGIEAFQEIKGNLAGLIVGEVLTVIKHPNADKLSVTEVNIGLEAPIQIVCGAPNVAAGQKVIVAPVGTTIYPTSGEPLTMKAMKIRGIESYGMICADDEIGLGSDHSGIHILDGTATVGTAAASLFDPYEDQVISIGLTPNRSDAMSHLGVARDVCAYLNHHEGLSLSPIIKLSNVITTSESTCPINVTIENTADCIRYTGILIQDVVVAPSPKWIQERLKAIGQRPINNIVDITNYMLHDTGQPLHAFDADKIKGNTIKVKNVSSGTLFKSLDEKDRKLDAGDLMICDNDNTALCMGGVFGGIDSGVNAQTKNLFLESAFFNPVTIRKSSFRHNLRTDAAMHFEKGVDIGQTVDVLKKAANLVCTNASGVIKSNLIDVYPTVQNQPSIILQYDYLRKMSGKHYAESTVKNILLGLGFTTLNENEKSITVQPPSHKTDISIPADIVEEVMRIDGFDNIEIPTTIMISPSVSGANKNHHLKEKLSNGLVGMGFNEMLNNSITHSENYTSEEMKSAVKMLNNLSAELDTLRLSMLETGLQTIARNLNHRNENLKLFEFGKTYSKKGNAFNEEDHLALFTSGNVTDTSWNRKETSADLFYIKGILESLKVQSGIQTITLEVSSHDRFEYLMQGKHLGNTLVTFGKPSDETLKKFDIRVPVIYMDIHWANWIDAANQVTLRFQDISKFPSVQRDLSFVLDKSTPFSAIEDVLKDLSINELKSYRLFDIFESDKLGKDKQSLAMNFIFQNENKTLKDEEIDKWMARITDKIQSTIHAEIRK